jgi:hypothetical protein
LALSFLGGFQVMALEICGLRTLQMNLGSSVVVTGTLLTLIMVVLSVGYYLGGTLRALHSPRALCLLLMAACGYTQIANVTLLDRIGDLALDLRDALDGLDHVEVGLPAALLSLLLYGPPMLALSMISPCLIRFESTQSSSTDAGKSSGFFMSLSTAGSIFGTLLASYVLIPAFGVRATASWTNAVLSGVLALALITFTRSERRRSLAAASLGALLLVGLLPVAHSDYVPGLLQDDESLYGRVRVIEDTDPRGQRFLAYQSTLGYWHSIIYPDEPLRALNGSIYLAPALIEPKKSMLILGSAAGGAARQSQVLMPEMQITGVDIDPAVHEVATKYFGVDPEKIRFVSRDARQFIERDSASYDFIIVDLFANEYVPAHCITREFFSQVKAHLNPGGAVFVNTNMFDIPFELPEGVGEPTRVNRHLERTVREAGFPSVFANNFFHSLVLYPTPQSFDHFLSKLRSVAADPTRPAATRAALGLMARTSFEVVSYPRSYQPFTDEWSPDIVLERKWNHGKIYDALRAAPSAEAALHPALRIVRDRLFADRASGARSGAITDAAALVSALEQLDQPLTAADEQLAARYLRFDLSEQPALEAHSPWAQLAADYAGMYAAGQSNDYEKLAQILGEMN